MSDSPDPSRLLASAALDREATDDERAQVESSAELSAELESYRRLRSELADVRVPTAARESGIAAALAAFDEMQPVAGVASTFSPIAPVVPMRSRRQRHQRWVGGAVAAAFVGLLGVAVINSGGADDDHSTADDGAVLRTAETDASTKTNAPDAETSDADAADDQVAGAAPAEAPPNQSADEGSASAETIADDDTSAQLPAAAPVATTSAAAATTAAEAAPTAAGGEADPWADAVTFSTEDELRVYANEPGSPLAVTTLATVEASADTTAASSASDTAESSPGTTAGTTGSLDDAVLDPVYSVCDTDGRPAAAVVYQGRRVLVVRDDGLGELQVITPGSCAVTSRIPLL